MPSEKRGTGRGRASARNFANIGAFFSAALCFCGEFWPKTHVSPFQKSRHSRRPLSCCAISLLSITWSFALFLLVFPISLVSFPKVFFFCGCKLARHVSLFSKWECGKASGLMRACVCVCVGICECICALVWVECVSVSCIRVRVFVVVLQMDGNACFLRDCLFGLCSGAYMAFPSGKMHICMYSRLYAAHTCIYMFFADT